MKRQHVKGQYVEECTKLKYKLIKDTDTKPDTLKDIEAKVGKSLKLMGTGGNFLNRIPVAFALRSRTDKWDLINCKAFLWQRTLQIGLNGQQHIGKRSSPIVHLIEC